MLPLAQPLPPATARRGTVLLVVITLLTLFAVVGLSFVYYADSEATSSRYFREAQALTAPDVEPELALAFFLNQLIYGARDDDSGVYSALRGHDLLRGVYGLNYEFGTSGEILLQANELPFNGTGRLHHLQNYGTVLTSVDDYTLVNYTYFPADGFLRDPERLNWRTGTGAIRGTFTGGFNVPYTYPDLNNFFLAAVRADGTVVMPSFHRHYLFNPNHKLNDPSNPNWRATNPLGKYLTLRPRPEDHAQDASGGYLFPYPEDEFGDVKNLPFGPGGNDSVWIDIGAPVMTAADGRKYKMLVAPLIIDLDGRINLNVAGNKGANGTTATNQGWGRWEINPGQLFPPADPEVPYLFNGNPNTGMTGRGRYGADGQPTLVGSASLPRPGPWYARVDANGTAGLPVLPAAGSFSPFPTFPGYDNASNLANHPALYNVFAQANVNGQIDRVIATANMEALLRYGDKGSPALLSEWFKLFPTNMKNARLRNLVTSDSFDLDRPGVTPYVWNPNSGGPTDYTLSRITTGQSLNPPSGQPIPFPTLPGAPVAGSEFASDWRAFSAGLMRTDLNRPLPDYPPQDPKTRLMPFGPQFTQAESARQVLAFDLYRALIQATGAADPNAIALPATDPKFKAARWLAQLAVNMVDYIDNDDYLTPFRWLKKSATFDIDEYVFGTELPRLVINEAYVQYDNDPTDPGLQNPNQNVRQASYYRLNAWVELHNPFKQTPGADAYPRDGGTAYLQIQGSPVYQLWVCREDGSFRSSPDNARGLPNVANAANKLTPTIPYSKVTVWGPAGADQMVTPADPSVQNGYADTTQTNKGFFVLGPAAQYLADPVADPRIKTTFLSADLSVKMDPPVSIAQGTTLMKPLFLLRRLAYLHLPPNDPDEPGFEPDPSKKALNPYITVDTFELGRGGSVADGRVYRHNAPGMVPQTPIPQRATIGRRQPYAGIQTSVVAQNPSKPALDQPKHTFFRHNGREDVGPPSAQDAVQTLDIPFTWLPHLDRPLRSPMELLHVHAGFPYQLTTQFGPPSAMQFGFNHYAPWSDDSSRLYRFFEFVRTTELAAGTAAGGRVAGKVNVNTMWDPEVLAAVLNDPQAAALFPILVGMRNPGGMIGPTDAHLAQTSVPAGYTLNRPFWGLATGASTPAATNPQYPNATGINNTLLRSSTVGGDKNSQRLFGLPGATAPHPYFRHEQLHRIYNHLTTRSNVFAVFLTVGFFEVKDDAVRPVKLGAEIGRAQNRHVRHRMFAIVDRSAARIQLLSNSNQPLHMLLQNNVVVQPGQLATSIMTGPAGFTTLQFRTQSGATWEIRPGTTFAVIPPAAAPTEKEETVLVTAVDLKAQPPTFTVVYRMSHSAGSELRPLGHPGPWSRFDLWDNATNPPTARTPRYDLRRDTDVVRYFSIID